MVVGTPLKGPDGPEGMEDAGSGGRDVRAALGLAGMSELSAELSEDRRHQHKLHAAVVRRLGQEECRSGRALDGDPQGTAAIKGQADRVRAPGQAGRRILPGQGDAGQGAGQQIVEQLLRRKAQAPALQACEKVPVLGADLQPVVVAQAGMLRQLAGPEMAGSRHGQRVGRTCCQKVHQPAHKGRGRGHARGRIQVVVGRQGRAVARPPQDARLRPSLDVDVSKKAHNVLKSLFLMIAFFPAL